MQRLREASAKFHAVMLLTQEEVDEMVAHFDALRKDASARKRAQG